MVSLKFKSFMILLIFGAITNACSLGNRTDGPSDNLSMPPTVETSLVASEQTPASTVTKTPRPLPTPTPTKMVIPASNKPRSGLPIIAEKQVTSDYIGLGVYDYIQDYAKEKYSAEWRNTVGKTMKYSVQLTTGEIELLLYRTFCASTTNQLSDVLKNSRWELTINEFTIDFDTLYQREYESSDGSSCYAFGTVLSQWPQGKTTVTLTHRFLKSVKIGSVFYPVGAITEVFNVNAPETESIAASSTEQGDSGLQTPLLGSKDETSNELNSLDFLFLEDAADGADLMELHLVDRFFNLDKVFVIHAPSKQKRLVWATGWCAADQVTLEKNLENIRFEMSINNTPIDIEQFYQFEIQAVRSIDFCRIYSLVAYDWPSGNTSLISKTIITSPINDGYKDYQVGEIVRTYTVKNLSQP